MITDRGILGDPFFEIVLYVLAIIIFSSSRRATHNHPAGKKFLYVISTNLKKK